MKYANIVSDIEGMFSVLTKIADRVGNDTIEISNTRAKEILKEIRSIKSQEIKSQSKHIRKEPAWLDCPE